MQSFAQLFRRCQVSPKPLNAADIWQDLVRSFPGDTIENITEYLSGVAVDSRWCKIVDEKIRNFRCWGEWRSWPANPATYFAKLVLALRGGAGPEDGLQKLRTILRIHSHLDFQFGL